MKRLWMGCIVMICGLWFSGTALAFEDVDQMPSCHYCGMDRGKFASTRMVIVYDDGTRMGTCSIHCAAVDMALNIDKTPMSIQVGDYGTKKLIDAEKAFWVIGGTKPGVMTTKAKWAFEQQADAEKFIQENGGVLTTFEEAMKAAYESMYQDNKMIRDKRRAMKMKGHGQS